MKLDKAVLPMDYENYVFDLYGTLVDIHTEEGELELWEKLAMFYGYYRAIYTPKELQNRYGELVNSKERELKSSLENNPKYSHEASPEIEITDVFTELFREKGVEPGHELSVHAGQFFRVLSTIYIRLYPGTVEMIKALKAAGKKVYLLSNAQRIFTEYEMHTLDIFKYFDDVLISSDYKTRKPDKRFFDQLICLHSIDPEQTLFIGNDSTTDIKGAKSVGFSSFYINSNISPQNDKTDAADYNVVNFEKWDY